jgi:hypothetical protein
MINYARLNYTKTQQIAFFAFVFAILIFYRVFLHESNYFDSIDFTYNTKEKILPLLSSDNINYEKEEEIDELEEIKSYVHKMEQFQLESVQENDQLLWDKNVGKIFFIESHLSKERTLENVRQACSVEAAGELAQK